MITLVLRRSIENRSIKQDIYLRFLDYKGDSSPARTITLESLEGVIDAEQAWANGNSNISTKVANNEVTTRGRVISPDETDEHPYKDAIFRLGKV